MFMEEQLLRIDLISMIKNSNSLTVRTVLATIRLIILEFFLNSVSRGVG